METLGVQRKAVLNAFSIFSLSIIATKKFSHKLQYNITRKVQGPAWILNKADYVKRGYYHQKKKRSCNYVR